MLSDWRNYWWGVVISLISRYIIRCMNASRYWLLISVVKIVQSLRDKRILGNKRFVGIPKYRFRIDTAKRPPLLSNKATAMYLATFGAQTSRYCWGNFSKKFIILCKEYIIETKIVLCKGICFKLFCGNKNALVLIKQNIC